MKSPEVMGNYEIISLLGEGGMGAVYKARSRATGEIVAVKVLPSSAARDPVFLKRFQQEFDAAARMEHPNVVRAIEYCGDGANPFLVMEYVEGESLGQKIERDGAMAEDLAVRLIVQVCQGLFRVHKNNMIHRDIKPDNILVTPAGVAKLTDLGLVKSSDNELNLTRTGRGLGTLPFMAPEQFRNAKNVDIRCDIYSLGATLYTMLTGEMPFDMKSPVECLKKKISNEFTPPRQLNMRISERVDWAIRRSMSGDPDQRPRSCSEFIEDLSGLSMRAPAVAAGANAAAEVGWYVAYKDEANETKMVKGTTESIRIALKDGQLGDASNIRVSQSREGPFLPLKTLPEFRDIVVEPAPMPKPRNVAAAATPKGTPDAPPMKKEKTAERPAVRPPEPPRSRESTPRQSSRAGRDIEESRRSEREADFASEPMELEDRDSMGSVPMSLPDESPPKRRENKKSDRGPQPDAPPIRPQSYRKSGARRKRSPAVIALVLVVMLGNAALIYFGAKFLLKPANGTMVVEVDDSAQSRYGTGELRIYDSERQLKQSLKPDERTLELPEGTYRLELTGAEGLILTTGDVRDEKSAGRSIEVKIEAKGKVVVRVLQKKGGE